MEKRYCREATRHNFDTQDDASKESMSSLLLSTILSINSRGSSLPGPVARC